MRVLVVGRSYPPGSSGGYELQCAGCVAHLRAYGHEVRVLTAAGPARAEPSGAVFRELRASPPDELHDVAVFDRHVREFRPDVVSWWRMAELSMALVGRWGGPAVGMVCDPWWRDGPERDPRGTEPVLSAARWLFVSHALPEAVGGAGDVVHAGIDLDALAPARERPWEGRLLCAGRLSRLKGADVAVSALAELPDTTLSLVGDAPDPEYAASLRAPRVRIAAAAPPGAMREAYAAADAVLFPVRWAEPWGLVPLEAMAVGRPVVATGTGGSAEYLRHEENALLVPPDDPTALAAAVRRLAGDPALRAHLRAGGRATAEAHPAEASHARVREALEAAARDGPARCARHGATVSDRP